MNPYQESLLRTHQAELAEETRALQLAGQTGAAPESESEVFRFGSVRRRQGLIRSWVTAISSWLRFQSRASRVVRPALRAERSSPTAFDGSGNPLKVDLRRAIEPDPVPAALE